MFNVLEIYNRFVCRQNIEINSPQNYNFSPIHENWYKKKRKMRIASKQFDTHNCISVKDTLSNSFKSSTKGVS